MTGTLPRSCPRCRRPRPHCACRNGRTALADSHTNAEPEFRGRARLIGIDVDDIKPGAILTTGKDIDVAGAWHCSAPGCDLRDIDRAVIEDHIDHVRQQAPRGGARPRGDRPSQRPDGDAAACRGQ